MENIENLTITIPVGKTLAEKAEKAVLSGKMMDLKNDIVFKMFFTKDKVRSKKLLCSFLSAVTGEKVQDTLVKNPELLPEFTGGKVSRLDILCTFNNGKQADVEMQMRHSGNNIRKRSLYYGSKLYASTLNKGENYIDIPTVYQIMIADFVEFNDNNFYHRFTMKDKNVELSDSLQVIFLELPKCRKQNQYNESPCLI